MIAYVGAGSNVGDREGTLRQAAEHLARYQWIRCRDISPFYETPPAGYLPQGFFLNAVVAFETELPPLFFFRKLRETEIFFGRKRAVRNGPRTIDLDFLAYDGWIFRKSGLLLPHPELHRRWFVLKPFSDIEPGWVHPLFRRTIRELLDDCLTGERPS